MLYQLEVFSDNRQGRGRGEKRREERRGEEKETRQRGGAGHTEAGEGGETD